MKPDNLKKIEHLHGIEKTPVDMANMIFVHHYDVLPAHPDGEPCAVYTALQCAKVTALFAGVHDKLNATQYWQAVQAELDKRLLEHKYLNFAG